MTVLVLGATGMLGHTLFRYLRRERPDLRVYGTVRSRAGLTWFTEEEREHLLDGVEAADLSSVGRAIATAQPEVVVNCIGMVKQRKNAADVVAMIVANSLFPHQLSGICGEHGSRLIHLSTDCVFCGSTGNYSEEDDTDAKDLYGRTKILGEITGEGCFTIRKSMIGHELHTQTGLLEWFLAQRDRVYGYQNAIFSGLTTIELSRIMANYFLVESALPQLVHVTGDPISKLELLRLVRDTYGMSIEIIPDESVRIDRSLDSSTFRRLTGYQAPPWPEMVREMYAERDYY